MERLSPEKAYLEAMATKAVAKGKSEKVPLAQDLEKADKTVDQIKAFDPKMVDLLGESQIMKEKLGPELNTIAVEIQDRVFGGLQQECDQELRKIVEESTELKEALDKFVPALKIRLIDKFLKEWEDAMRSHEKFAGKEKLLDESLPDIKKLFSQVLEDLIDKTIAHYKETLS